MNTTGDRLNGLTLQFERLIQCSQINFICSNIFSCQFVQTYFVIDWPLMIVAFECIIRLFNKFEPFKHDSWTKFINEKNIPLEHVQTIFFKFILKIYFLGWNCDFCLKTYFWDTIIGTTLEWFFCPKIYFEMKLLLLRTKKFIPKITSLIVTHVEVDNMKIF